LSGTVLLGRELEAFEQEFAAFCGSTTAVGVASGTDAIRLSLTALGIEPGSEVIVPAFGAVPTAAAVVAAGGVPVFADVDPLTAGLSAGSVAGAMTSRTSAIVVVHLYGRRVDVRPFLRFGVPIVEDAAQAHGAADGSLSAAVCYSFYPTKNLGGIGDGGAVTTEDPALADRVRCLRHHGMRAQYVHEFVSTNSRMSEIEAAFLRLALPLVRPGNERRREIASACRMAAPHLQWHPESDRHVYHLCVLRVPDRDRFVEKLSAAGVSSGIHYPLALTRQPAYRRYASGECPEAERWAGECVSLPCFPEMTEEEVEEVCRTLRDC
jgi:dTDP-4-amino-4,6-dideoxygalactose transaminase